MNRHADALSDFTECVQAALNRNGHKPDLDTLTPLEIREKTCEESRELDDELKLSDPFWYAYTGRDTDPRKVEREAADLAVCALAAWMWARREG